MGLRRKACSVLRGSASACRRIHAAALASQPGALTCELQPLAPAHARRLSGLPGPPAACRLWWLLPAAANVQLRCQQAPLLLLLLRCMACCFLQDPRADPSALHEHRHRPRALLLRLGAAGCPPRLPCLRAVGRPL